MQSISIIRPDDWHCHLRDGERLAQTVTQSARVFGRVVVMPNLNPPITTVEEALAYRQRVLDRDLPQHFTPMMTLYLHADMRPDDIVQAAESEHIIGIKCYPAGVTTHSSRGIDKLETIYPLLELMQQHRLPLLIHGESNDPYVDVFDRESHFIDHHLIPIIKQFPALRIVLEHISTTGACDFIAAQDQHIGATITVHHLLYNRNQMLGDGLKPHLYCMPLLKARRDQQALIAAATSGDPHFFLGTDSAPHTIGQKQSACGCAGVYSAPTAIECCTQLFDQQQALERLENFTSVFGAEFYEYKINCDKITLNRSNWTAPEYFDFGQDKVIPMAGGQSIAWSVA